MQKIKKILTVCIASCYLCGCGTTENNGSLTVQISDLTPPKIKLEKKAYEITEGDSFAFANCYAVSDNITSKPDVSVDKDGFDASKPGKYTITITAEDEAGNKANDSFTVTVKEKPKPTPTPTPEPEETEEPSSGRNTGASSESHTSSGGTTQTAPEPVAPSRPSSQFFPFGADEHDGGTAAGQQCKTAGYAACLPYDQDGDGVYDGYLGQ